MWLWILANFRARQGRHAILESLLEQSPDHENSDTSKELAKHDVEIHWQYKADWIKPNSK